MIQQFFLTLIDLFYPSHCVGCQQALLGKMFLCSDCWREIEPIGGACCQICSYPLLTADLKTCNNCAERKLHFVAGIAAFRYQGLTKELLARYKYGHDQSLKPLLKQLIVRGVEDHRLQGIDFTAIVPVPLHSIRERERGFNQVLPLAQQIAKFKKSPLQNLLIRKVPTSFQATAGREERLKNLEGAFVVKHSKPLRGKYLLVDDVLTTGATLNECAKALRHAGADEVWAVTLAR